MKVPGSCPPYLLSHKYANMCVLCPVALCSLTSLRDAREVRFAFKRDLNGFIVVESAGIILAFKLGSVILRESRLSRC